MSSSTHQIKVKAVDQTAGAFGSIKNRAAATGAQIRSMMGGAIAAAGAYLSFSSVKNGIAELAHLDDIAMKTSTSLGEITSAATALDVLGIQNMSVENLAKAFDYMAKTTGRSGMEGFYKTIEELGQIEDVAKRGQEAMRIFGRTGMEFMPIINGAKESTAALQTVIGAFPQLPQAAATAGGRVDDMMGFFVGELKSIWLQGLGTICGWLDNEFQDSAAQASMGVAAKMTYYAQVGAAKMIAWYQKVKEYLYRFSDAIGAFIGTKMGGGSWSEAFENAGEAYTAAEKNYDEVAAEIDAKFAKRQERFKRVYEDRMINVRKFDEASGEAAVGIGANAGSKAVEEAAAAKAAAEAALKSPAIRNELILGGHDANRLAALGPQVQSEAKKQTALLEKIVDNTKTVADNAEEADGENYGEWNG